MLKMLIRMDNHKIETEQKYNSESIYSTLNNAFSRMRFQRISDESNALVYCDNETGQTHGSFCQIINSLKKQGWFMENVSDWILYHSDVSDNPGDFREEDLLARYQRRRSIKA